MLITPEVLLKFSTFQQLSEQQQQSLLDPGKVKMLYSVPGEKIISRGSNDDFSVFLVSGSLKLIAKDGHSAVIKADSDSARQPITQLRPRQYDVIADSAVNYLMINNLVLDNLQSGTQKTAEGIQVESEPGDSDIYFQLYQDIKADHVILPSLSDVALKINTAISSAEKINTHQLSEFVLADPAITAKLIKLAVASTGTEPATDIENIEHIIDRLGVNKTLDVVRVLSTKDLFKPANALHQQLIKENWRETLYISAIAAVLAEEFEHLDSKKAQLVGSMHNIGTILILDCLGKDNDHLPDAHQIQAIITELAHNISAMLLEKWGFAQPFITAAKDSQHWQRNNNNKPLDYCDLVIIAKLLSYVATPKIENTPVLIDLPVFRKLHWEKNGIAKGLHVLNRAKQKIHTLIQVFDK